MEALMGFFGFLKSNLGMIVTFGSYIGLDKVFKKLPIGLFKQLFGGAKDILDETEEFVKSLGETIEVYDKAMEDGKLTEQELHKLLKEASETFKEGKDVIVAFKALRKK